MIEQIITINTMILLITIIIILIIGIGIYIYIYIYIHIHIYTHLYMVIIIITFITYDGEDCMVVVWQSPGLEEPEPLGPEVDY